MLRRMMLMGYGVSVFGEDPVSVFENNLVGDIFPIQHSSRQ